MYFTALAGTFSWRSHHRRRRGDTFECRAQKRRRCEVCERFKGGKRRALYNSLLPVKAGTSTTDERLAHRKSSVEVPAMFAKAFICCIVQERAALSSEIAFKAFAECRQVPGSCMSEIAKAHHAYRVPALLVAGTANSGDC